MKIDRSLLEAALIGYSAEHQKLQEKINALRTHLTGHTNGAATIANAGGITRRGTMSVAARQRIAAAQRKRWAAFHAKQLKPTASKGTVTPERRAALAANLARARAARAAKRAAA
jgi:cell division septum initiation protein DivIVA